ncbi:hypothetical protein PF003_g22998 [Phytophthora fragariae]|nr:hypothetical protein PF003_g22998 [Phytophthora fragariae]
MVAKRTRGSGVDASNDGDKGKGHDDLPVGPRAATPAGDAAPPAAPASTGKVIIYFTTEREERARAREVLPDLLRSPGLHLLPGLLGRDLQRTHLLRQLLLLLLGLLELLQHPKRSANYANISEWR